MDRSLGRNARSADPELANCAFYSSDSPGRGVEVWFSNYEAFALMTGLRLLQHRWPQSFPVAVLRRLRPQLEREHARILKQDPKILFDQKQIRENARPGDLYVDKTDPVFQTIASGQDYPGEGPTGALPCAVCRGMEQVFKFVKQQNARSHSLNELVTPAHALLSQLSKVQPRKRGRSG
ncbi:MAG: hypothetical protein ACJ8LM_09655 [Candidatus Udaeobacter sp.]